MRSLVGESQTQGHSLRIRSRSKVCESLEFSPSLKIFKAGIEGSLVCQGAKEPGSGKENGVEAKDQP